MGKQSRPGSGMIIPDSESLETIFWVKILKVFDADPDTGSMNSFDPGSEVQVGKKLTINDKTIKYFIFLPVL
jgi:hypothetical protein